MHISKGAIRCNKVQSVVCQWLQQQPALFFALGIKKLVDRRDKCLSELGQYVEKLKR